MNNTLLNAEIAEIKTAAERFNGLTVVIVFGSVAKKSAHYSSDLDIAVSCTHALDIDSKIQMIEAFTLATGRPVDLVDLHEVGEPLLGQILQYGQWLIGSETQKGEWLSRQLIDAADFSPYQEKILTERRNAWIKPSLLRS